MTTEVAVVVVGVGGGNCRRLLEGGERWLSQRKQSLSLHPAAAAAGSRRCIQMDAPMDARVAPRPRNHGFYPEGGSEVAVSLLRV